LKQAHLRRRQKIKLYPPPQPEIELSSPMPRYDTSADRRQFPRTKLVEIAYIGMGPENGGLVLDVSDGGLSFHSVAPVQRAETIRFLLSLRGHSRIEGAGEVVWTNDMRTVCGLRFTALSSGAREHLNNWTNLSRPAVAAVKEPEEPGYSAPSPEAAPVKEIEQAEEVEAMVEEHPDVVPTSALPVSRAPLAIARETEPAFEPAFTVSPSREFYLSAPLESSSFWQSPVLSWLAVGLLTASLTAAGYLYGVRVGQSQGSSSSHSSANPGAQTEPSLLQAAPVAASPVPDEAPPGTALPAPLLNGQTSAEQNTASVSKVAVSAAPGSASALSSTAAGPASAPASPAKIDDATGQSPRPAAEKHVPTAADLRAQQEAAKAQLAAALSYLNGDTGRRDTGKAVQLLWASVRNGNSDAEVTLSDLYVTGDGVEKNCEQARVLLKAATKSGNPAGMVKLGELETGGCP
jgi:PilZ domain